MDKISNLVKPLRVKVFQLTSPKSGNEVANQFDIETEAGHYFQSYRSIIAFKEFGTGQVFLDETYWDYSRTTAKYRSQWLGENTKETQAKIKSGEYQLVDLNS